MNNFLKYNNEQYILKEKNRHVETIKTIDLESKKIDYKILKIKNNSRHECFDSDSENN